MLNFAPFRRVTLTVAALLTSGTAGASTLTTLYQFAGGADGNSPQGGLAYRDGLLYGTTAYGSQAKSCGSQGCGTVFSVDPVTGTEKVIHGFTLYTGTNPEAALLSKGQFLYGTLARGGSNGFNGAGSLFRTDPSNGQTKILYRFGERPDGFEPVAGLTSFERELYGTTGAGGGSSSDGILFAVTKKGGSIAYLHNFTTPDGNGGGPAGKLLLLYGIFYGTTVRGGGEGNSLGTIYKFDPTTKAFATIYSFSGTANGKQPRAGLVSDGTLLYGTTSLGGIAKADAGTVFKIDPKTGALAALYKFQGGADGANPVSSLIYQNGLLYGTTSKGGAAGAGTIFQVDPATGAEKVLYSFTGAGDGATPVTELTFANKTFYGTTSAGGLTNASCPTGCGTVFQFTP